MTDAGSILLQHHRRPVNFITRHHVRYCSLLILWTLLFSFTVSRVTAQATLNLRITLSDTLRTNTFESLRKQVVTRNTFRDSTEIIRELQSMILKLQGSGYLSASTDSLRRVDQYTFLVVIFLGELYQWATLSKGNVDGSFLSGTGFNRRLFEKKPLQYAKIRHLEERILANCENNGYPFASIRLDSLQMNQAQLSAALRLEKNKLIRIDSVLLNGSPTLAPVFIHNYIGIHPGDLYNEMQVSRISNRLKELPFIREVRPNRILFTDKETKLELFLENKKASQFDGVVGLLPDEKKSGKYALTGEAHLKLQNSLKRGEIIELNWKQFPGSTQDLKVHVLYPYLFNTPFGLDGNLSLYKKDSTYVDVIKNLGVQYNFTGNNFLKGFVTEKESDLQSTRGLENITVLPSFADMTTLTYGLTFHLEHVDYRLNPREGILLETTGSSGNRTIRKNQDINPAVYDSIQLKTASYHAEISIDYFFPAGGRNVINLGVKAAHLHNSGLFTNELFRIGGLKSLRGFDEESIYASAYSIAKAEYRYLLEQNSFLFLFLNGAWYENKSRNQYLRDTPWGFGAGIDFETKLGIMSVSYALGKQFGNPVLFRNGKIHFGIVNYF